MGKTFDQSLIDTANIPMSMIDPEDMADTSSEEFVSMRRVQQGCHSELTNREDFPFNIYTKTIKLSKGMNTYSMVDGKIKNVYCDNNKLEFVSNFRGLGTLTNGTPVYFTTQANPEKIKLFPSPDKSYTLEIEYVTSKNVLLADGTPSPTIEKGSTARMPERVQHLYFDALEYYVLATNMRKESNPRWQPTLEIFNQRWRIFLKGCKTYDKKARIVW